MLVDCEDDLSKGSGDGVFGMDGIEEHADQQVLPATYFKHL